MEINEIIGSSIRSRYDGSTKVTTRTNRHCSVLKGFDFVTQGESQDELVVTNPPTFKVDEDQSEFVYE